MGATGRGVATGLAGSAAVLMVAALSLSAGYAQADGEAGFRLARPAAPPVVVRAEPAADRLQARPILQPAWLKRLLSRSDLEPAPRRG